LLDLQHLLGPDQGLAENVSERAGVDTQQIVGLADAEIVEEDLIERLVVVLSGVDQHVIDCLVESSDDARQSDQLRPRPDDCHHLEHQRETSAIV
jgi:hypothetical protein